MTPEQLRGRTYTVGLIGGLLVLDIVLKGLLLAAGKLRPAQVVGTIVTVAICWALWRGSRAAHLILIGCLGIATVLMGVAPKFPPMVAIPLFALFGMFLLTLLAPATRAFLAHQGQSRT
jgi:hypothetical protein